MNHEEKKMILDAFIKTVDSAPTRSTSVYQQGVTKESFDIWINYVYSVFQISSKYIDPALYLSVYRNIQSIAAQINTDYSFKTNAICQQILSFAHTILNI